MNVKEMDIQNYSDPQEVLRKAHLMFGDDIDFQISTRRNKKYMIRGKFSNNKWIHFGQYGMEDYTKHQDQKRLNKFKQRNWRWSLNEPDTASFLSYYLLWN